MLADFISELRYRLRTLFNRTTVQRELDDELRFHMELEVEKYMRQGMSRAEATRRARVEFGSVESYKEESRSLWGFQWVEHAATDLRYATRRLRQRPGFTLAVIGVLALGIGATTAMFSAVDAAILRPLPFPDSDQLVTLRNVSIPTPRALGKSADNGTIDITDAAKMPDLFTHVGAFAAGGLNISDPERPRRVAVGVVTANFFELIGVPPAVGRGFVAEEGAPGAEPVAVISHELWVRQFGRRDVNGLTMPLNGTTHRIVGVMPAGFRFPSESDLWIPISVPLSDASFEAFRGWIPTQTIARLTPGLTPEIASARLLERWMQRRPAPVAGRPPSPVLDWLDEMRRLGAVNPLQRQLVGDRSTALLILLGATGLLLLIACANVMNLLLSDGTSRQREIAVRHVLGASRGRVVRQLLAESVLLALVGTAAGVAMAPVALRVMQVLLPKDLAGVAPAQIDLRVLGFAATLALITGIAFGLLPALRTTRPRSGPIITGGAGRTATAERSGRMRRMLVGAELALTLMLLVGAGLMLRSFRNLMQVDLGLNPESVATLEITIPESAGGHRYRVGKINAILDRLRTMPGIEAAGAVNDLPLGGMGGLGFQIDAEGETRPADAEPRFAHQLLATGGYFEALGIRLLRGRTFTAADDSLAPRVAVISESMAKQLWPDRDPIGLRFGTRGYKTDLFTVVGVVADVRESGVHQEPDPQMYMPLDWASTGHIAIVARGTLPSTVLMERLGAAVRAADPAQATYNVRAMDDVISTAVAPRRTQTVLIGSFAGLALILAAFGVYAVVAYGVTQRSRELGIRSALGATRADLMTLVAGEMFWVTIGGVLVGLAGAWALARVLKGLVYGVDVHDPMTFAVVPVVLAAAAAVAAFVPARRAARVDPVEVIRVE